MFLALSAIAMTLGTAMTIHDLTTEQTSVQQQTPAAVVEVAPIQVQETQIIEIGR